MIRRLEPSAGSPPYFLQGAEWDWRVSYFNQPWLHNGTTKKTPKQQALKDLPVVNTSRVWEHDMLKEGIETPHFFPYILSYSSVQFGLFLNFILHNKPIIISKPFFLSSVNHSSKLSNMEVYGNHQFIFF